MLPRSLMERRNEDEYLRTQATKTAQQAPDSAHPAENNPTQQERSLSWEYFEHSVP